MENLEEILNLKLHRQLQLIQNKRLYPHMDWIALERIVVQELVPYIANEVSELLKEHEETSRKLRAKLNQLSFGNDPERDKRIVELFNQGVSNRQIAKKVGLTPFGITKALRRLGVN